MATKFANKRRLRKNRKARMRMGGPSKRPGNYITLARRRVNKARVARNIRVKHIVGAISDSYCTIKHRANRQIKAMEQVGAPNIYLTDTSADLRVFSGTQAAVSFAALNNTIVKTLLNNVTGTPISGLPRRMALQNAEYHYTLANNTNVPIEVDIYDIVPKRDILSSFVFTANLLSYPVTPYPEKYWDEGTNAQNSNAPGTYPSPANYLGGLPQDSQLFKEYFAIKRKAVVQLPCGGVHRHNVNIASNCLADDYLANATTSALVGRSSFVMFVVRGFPCFGTPAGGGNQPTTTSATIQVIQTVRVKYTWVQDLTYSLNAFIGLPSFSPADQKTVNTASGAIQSTDGTFVN